MEIPDGFRPIAELRTSPFLDRVGPFYFRRRDRDLVLGLRVGEGHANARGAAHGVDTQQLGSRMAFANAYLTAGERRVARVSAAFLRTERSG